MLHCHALRFAPNLGVLESSWPFWNFSLPGRKFHRYFAIEALRKVPSDPAEISYRPGKIRALANNIQIKILFKNIQSSWCQSRRPEEMMGIPVMQLDWRAFGDNDSNLQKVERKPAHVLPSPPIGLCSCHFLTRTCTGLLETAPIYVQSWLLSVSPFDLCSPKRWWSIWNGSSQTNNIDETNSVKYLVGKPN